MSASIVAPASGTAPRGARLVVAPRGTELSCRGWQQEAALRMLMNNLDPEVAERPDDLVVYGGNRPAAGRWGAVHATGLGDRPLGDAQKRLVPPGKAAGGVPSHHLC